MSYRLYSSYIVMLMYTAGNTFYITADLFGYGGRIFFQHPSNLLEAAPLQEFLLYAEPVGGRKTFLGVSVSMSHCRSFPADR